MGNIDKNVLKNIYQSSKIGLESSKYLYTKITDRDIKSQLNNYVKRYLQILTQTEELLKGIYNNIDTVSTKRQFMWNEINNIKSFTDKEEIARLLMSGSKEGISRIIPYSNNDMVDDNIKKLANNYIMCEKDNINNVLKYIDNDK